MGRNAKTAHKLQNGRFFSRFFTLERNVTEIAIRVTQKKQNLPDHTVVRLELESSLLWL
jgi:hypothetical protein